MITEHIEMLIRDSYKEDNYASDTTVYEGRQRNREGLFRKY